MNDLLYERVQGYLARLNLSRIADHLDPLAEEAGKAQWTYLEFLDRLLETELSARYPREVAMKTKLAHFPFVKTLDEFDFAFQPSVNERQIRELATIRFVANSENVLLLGPARCGQDPSGDCFGRGRHCPVHQRLLSHRCRLARHAAPRCPR